MEQNQIVFMVIGIILGSFIMTAINAYIFAKVLGWYGSKKNIRRIKIMLECMNAKNGIDPQEMYDKYDQGYDS